MQFTKQLKAYLDKPEIDNLNKLHYMFDGQRKYNSGEVTATKAKEILQRVFRDSPTMFYQLKPSLFADFTDVTSFIEFVNSESFIDSPILNFVTVQ